MADMTADELWKQFSLVGDWEAWQFGGESDADGLAHLAATGVKTATSSAYPLYELEGEPLPHVGAYGVVLDSKDNAVCIVQTMKVGVMPFREVPALHAYLEGEGDRTLEYWRKVHERFFTQELREAGLESDEGMPVVCEEFRCMCRVPHGELALAGFPCLASGTGTDTVPVPQPETKTGQCRFAMEHSRNTSDPLRRIPTGICQAP